MSDREFFEWFERENPDIPEGTEVTLTYDMNADQLIACYLLGGEEYRRFFNADMIDGTVVYKEVGVPRNVFENHEEAEEPKKVPLTIEETGEVIGHVWINKDGAAVQANLTPEAYKKYFPPPEPGQFSIADPADRYRVSPPNE